MQQYVLLCIHVQDLTQTCKILLQNTGISRGKQGYFAITDYKLLINCQISEYICVSANLQKNIAPVIKVETKKTSMENLFH